MTFTVSPESYGIPVDTAALSLTEKAGLVTGAGSRERVPVDDLVATEDSVVVDAVNKYRVARSWEGYPMDLVRRADHYLILDGHHRAAAAADAGADRVLAHVIENDP